MDENCGNNINVVKNGINKNNNCLKKAFELLPSNLPKIIVEIISKSVLRVCCDDFGE